MKNKNKMFILMIIVIVSASMGVGATTLYQSTQIAYTPSDDSTITNVQDALNNLYSIKTELNYLKQLGDATADNISEGKTAVVNGVLVTGSGVDNQTYYNNGMKNSNKTFQLRISGSINNLGNGSATAYIDNVGTVSVNFKKPSVSGSSTGFNSDTVTVTLAN